MATTLIRQVIQKVRQVELLRAAGSLTDGRLLDQFIERRDEVAFEALVRRHGPMVLGVCRRVLGNVHDAEDAFQATFLVLARRAASLGEKELVGNWLYGVASRTALEARRRKARRGARERQVADMPHPTEEPRDETWHELRRSLDEELGRLPDKYRLPVVLCDLEGRSRKEVARQLGLPEGTLSSRLATAREKLAGRLARRGLALPAGALAAVLSPQGASASVSAPLVTATVRAALLVAAGKAATGVVPAAVAALAERITRTLVLGQSKTLLGWLLVVGLVGSGAGALVSQALPAGRPEAGAAQPALGWRVRATLKGHTEMISCLAFSPDGKTFASAAWDRTVKLWDVETGRETGTLANDDVQMEVAFSPDGKTLAVGGVNSRTVNLWDVATRKVRTALPVEGGVHSLAFRPDGKTLAARVADGWVSAVKLWDVEAERERATLKPHDMTKLKQFTSRLAFSPDGKTLATCELDDSVRLWDVATARELARLPHQRMVGCLAFSPDGKTLATLQAMPMQVGKDGQEFLPGYDNIKLWDVATRKERLAFPELKKDVGGLLTFSPDGKLLVTAGAPVRLWDVATGAVRHDLGNRSHINSLAFSPSGDILATADNKVVKLWSRGPLPGAKKPDPAPDADERGKAHRPEPNAVRERNGRNGEGTKEGSKPPVAEQAEPDSPVARAYRSLVQEYEDWARSGEQRLQAAKTDAERQALFEKFRPEPKAFAGRLLALAEKHPDDPAAVDALLWCVLYLGHGPEAERAAAVLGRRHVRSGKLVALFPRLTGASFDPATQVLLRGFAENGADDQTRAQARFKLAKSLLATAELSARLRQLGSATTEKELENEYALGADLVKVLRAQDPARLTAEAEALLREVGAKFPGVAHPYVKGTLGEAAERELAELRNPTVAVGKPAPETQGTDVAGERFRLSDYRGKVVVLDFFGHW